MDSAAKVASPQLGDGYTRIANELLEALAHINLTKYQARVVFAIIRKTYGYGKKTDWVSQTQLSIMTGIHRSHICRTMAELKARKIVTTSGNTNRVKIGINKDYLQWKKLPATVIVTRPGQKVTSYGNNLLPATVHTKERKKITKESAREERPKKRPCSTDGHYDLKNDSRSNWKENPICKICKEIPAHSKRESDGKWTCLACSVLD